MEVAMARCRNLKPGFFKNEKLAELPPLVRILFAGLWCNADREGRLEDRPKRIKAEILPYEEMDVDDGLNQLTRGDDPFIVRYQVDGVRYIQVLKFHDHQSPHNTEKPSVIPEFSLSNETITEPRQLPLEVRGTEVRGNSRKRGAREKPKRQQILAADVPVPSELDTPEVRQAITDWLEYKTARGARYADASYFGRKVSEYARAGPDAFVAAVNSSIGNNYNGLYPPSGFNGKQQNTITVGPGQRFQG
jgi:hypothetical protein